MRIAVVADDDGGGRLWEVDGGPEPRSGRGVQRRVSDLAGAVADLERSAPTPPR